MKTAVEPQTYIIKGMDCANCAQTLEQGVSKLDNVTSCTVNFTTETMRVSGSAASEAIVRRIRDLGYDIAAPDQQPNPLTHPPANFLGFLWQRADTRLALLGALLVLPGLLFDELLPGLGYSHPLFALTSITAMVVAGYPIARSAWRAVRINREININVLMTLAAIGATLIGAYTEAGLVMVLFAIGEAMEGYTASRARASIRSLMTVTPQQATVLRPCIDCQGHLGQGGYMGGPCPFCGLEAQRVAVEALLVGDKILVKPGERIAMDGQIVAGQSRINQAPITGESQLLEKGVGDGVFASSINGEGVLEVEVTHLAADNTISRLVKLVEEAQEKRAPAQRFVDQFARYYTPAVVVLALLTAVIPPLLFNQPFWDAANPTQGWAYRALALLVVACPCALVISTPVSIISAISNGARHGVLFKGGAFVEALSRVQAIAFDKTGTLTEGRPSVVSVRAASCQDGPARRCLACDELLALTHAVEQRSEHPLAQAVMAETAQRGLARHYPAATEVMALAGLGIQGKVNGRSVLVGSHSYFDDHIPHVAHCGEVTHKATSGYTTMLVSADDSYMGYIAVADTVRPSSATAVAALKQLGLQMVMLTGDNPSVAQAIGQEVGIDQVQANCLPEDKVTAVATLRQQHGHVAMVGDGINDTPALATASVGIALGHTAQAMETADISLMGNDLSQLPFAIRLSRATMRTIRVNVAFSVGIKLLFLALVLAGWGSMWLAVLADVGTSLLVTLHGMRLLRTP